MRKPWSIALLVLPVMIAVGSTTPPDSFGISADELRVRAAVLDYVEAIYERDTDRMARSLHPDVRRHTRAAQEGRAAATTLAHDDLIALADARLCNASLPRRGPKRISVYELRDNVAAAKLTAAWGVDLLHLAKEDGKWRIVGIVGTAPRQLKTHADEA
jgi:hypothetical protein